MMPSSLDDQVDNRPLATVPSSANNSPRRSPRRSSRTTPARRQSTTYVVPHSDSRRSLVGNESDTDSDASAHVTKGARKRAHKRSRKTIRSDGNDSASSQSSVGSRSLVRKRKTAANGKNTAPGLASSSSKLQKQEQHNVRTFLSTYLSTRILLVLNADQSFFGHN